MLCFDGKKGELEEIFDRRGIMVGEDRKGETNATI